MYYRNAHCAVVVYDVTQPVSGQSTTTAIAMPGTDPHLLPSVATSL